MTDFTALLDTARTLPGVRIASVTLEASEPEWSELEALINRPLPESSPVARAADYSRQRDRLAFKQQIQSYCQALERQCLDAFDRLHEGRSPQPWIY